MNPKIAKINPPILIWLSLNKSNFFKMLFIFEGNRAYRIPSINKNKPKAINSSFIYYCWISGFIFPKNLKNSESGDKIKDVSPPIKAFS